MLWAGDPAPEALSRVGGDRPDRLLARIQSIRIAANIFAPESLLETGLQVGRLAAQICASRRIAERVEYLGHTHPGVEDVTLELTEGFGLLDLATVWIHYGIPGILPSHVVIAHRGMSLILLEAIAIQIAILIDPVEAALRNLAVLMQEAHVRRPFPRLVQHDQVENCGISRAIVRGVRNLVEVR